MKICSKCRKEKQYTDFHKDASRLDGYHYYCKSCNKEHRQTDHYKKLKSNTDRRYRNKYADELKKKKAAYYIKNQERIKDKMRQRYAEKSGEYKERARQRKNRLKSTIQEPYTKQQIYDRDNGLCFLCEELVDLSLNHPNPMCFSFQHAMPLILGGYDTPDNVLTSHLVCNLRQGTKPFDIGRSHL